MYAIYLSSVWQGVEPNLTNPTKLKLTEAGPAKVNQDRFPGKKGSSLHKFDFGPAGTISCIGVRFSGWEGKISSAGFK